MTAASPYTAEHEAFRDQVRRFVAREIVPNHEEWERAGVVPREAWEKAGAAGLLCCEVPEEYGGPGGDFGFSAVVIEELARAGATGPGFSVHSDVVEPYILRYGSEDQKREWLPRLVSGGAIAAIAMTEPGASSDLQGIRTTARADGNHLVVDGRKTFITNGQSADLVVVVAGTTPPAARTGPASCSSRPTARGSRAGATWRRWASRRRTLRSSPSTASARRHRIGQMDLACAMRHDARPGRYLRAEHISQGHVAGFPAYMLRWGRTVGVHRRFQFCNEQARAEPLPLDHPDYNALQLYVAWRGNGLPIEAPAVRR